MKKLILAAVATATLATPFVVSAADAQARRTVIVEQGPRGHIVRRVVVRQPYHGRQHRQHYVTRRVTTRYR